MTTIADFKNLFVGLPDDTPILIYNSECVISDCAPRVEDMTIAGDDEYYWRGKVDEEEITEEGFESSNTVVRKAIWINGDEP
jgi:hypothetical protein